MKIPQLTKDKRGSLVIHETLDGKLVRSIRDRFTVKEVRTKDFILIRDNKPGDLYCQLPKNSKRKPDSNEWETTEIIVNGFNRVYHMIFDDGRKNEISTSYIFD